MTGPGILSESFELAFEPFQRLESSRNRETGGTGLGLSIARDIALAHGGQISLTNASPGSGGLIVSVLLPKALAAASYGWSPAHAAGGLPRGPGVSSSVPFAIR
jgi:signal transduction histidine kinase